jgi:SAM-dependent methyltransferase
LATPDSSHALGPGITSSAIELLSTDGVTPLIHEDDFIYRFLAEHPLHAKNARSYYFEDGRKSAELLKGLIETDTAVPPGAEFELLEFASGYGCVTRHLPRVLPRAQITACDIHEEAISFIEDEIGQKALLSRSNPKDFELGAQFDIVFALSFFSHMPKTTWDDWLAALFRHVRVGGSLIFTSNGKYMLERTFKDSVSLSPEGFWFNRSSEQHDIDVSEYGTTIVAPEYVTRRIFQRLGGALAFFSPGFWWGAQDVWVVTKLADRDVAALDAALSKRNGQLAALRQSTAREQRLAAKNSELRHALHAVSNELRDRESRLVTADGDFRRLHAEIAARDQRLATTETQLHCIETSKAWRLARTMQKMAERLRRKP